MILENTYPIKGFQVKVNNYTNWSNFMNTGLFVTANDNIPNIDHAFGNEQDLIALKNLKIIFCALYDAYAGYQMGHDFPCDDIGTIIDYIDDLTALLERHYEEI